MKKTRKRTAPDITDEQIRRLADAAAAHGDDEQMGFCEAALRGHAFARRKCAEAIRYE